MSATQLEDRRRSQRLKGRKEAILITPSGMHNIRDLSENGLSFQCPEDDFFPSRWPVEIIFAGTTLYMKGIPVRMVREEFDEVDTVLSVPRKAVAVEFLDMDDTSRKMLHELLKFHCAGSA